MTYTVSGDGVGLVKAGTVRKVALLEEKERERAAGGSTL